MFRWDVKYAIEMRLTRDENGLEILRRRCGGGKANKDEHRNQDS